MATSSFGGRKVREGTVVSDKMAKTVVVAVEANLRHPLYKKMVRRLRRFMAHDEGNDCHIGDRVRIVESRPLSRRKRWRVVEVLQRVELPEVQPESIDLDLLGEVKVEEEALPAGAAAAAAGLPEEPEAAAEEGPEAVAEEEPEVEAVEEAEASREEQADVTEEAVGAEAAVQRPETEESAEEAEEAEEGTEEAAGAEKEEEE